MNRNLYTVFFVLGLLATLIAGCGSGGSSGVTAAAVPNAVAVASAPCIGCHNTYRSSVTGTLVTDDWQASAHHTKNGASCGDCHEPSVGHPNNCADCHGGGNPANVGLVHNPDESQKCFKCHGLAFPQDIMLVKSPQHFTNVTSGAFPAAYVSKQFIGRCRACHDPHNPTAAMTISRQWAQSGKGDVKAPPWTNFDFKSRGTAGAMPATSTSADCVRCHTTTGFINYVTSDFTNISPFGTASETRTSGKEVLACPACHDDGLGNAYGYKLRSVPPITGHYNYSSATTKKLLLPFQFPDISSSNICMSCHTGRESGRTLNAIGVAAPASFFANAGFVNSHYLTAGATIFRASGYEFAGRDYSNVAFYEHDQIGRNNFKGTGTRGPCIGCHLSGAESHSFLPVEKDVSGPNGVITAITSPLCAVCHTGQFAWTVERLEEEKTLHTAALEALNTQLKLAGFYFSNANPYFFTAPFVTGYKETGSCSSNLPVKNWQTGGSSIYTWNPTTRACVSSVNAAGTSATGEANMGAAFNYNLIFHDFGAFAHNRFYVKRLIYDSIDMLDDGILNYSTGQTLSGNGTDITPAVQYLIKTATFGGTDYINLTGLNVPEQRP